MGRGPPARGPLLAGGLAYRVFIWILPFALLLATIVMLTAAEWGFAGSFWAGAGIFVWVCAIWAFLYAFVDMIRRRDLSGGAKAGWTVLLLISPLLGAMIYLIARPTVLDQDLEDDRRRAQEESFGRLAPVRADQMAALNGAGAPSRRR